MLDHKTIGDALYLLASDEHAGENVAAVFIFLIGSIIVYFMITRANR